MQKQVFLSLFISSFIFLVASYFSGAFSLLHLAAFLLFPTLAILRVWGRPPAFYFVISSLLYIILFSLEHISTLYLHMSFIFFSLYFLWPQRKALIRGCGSLPKRLGYGIAIFLFMLFASLLVNLLLHFSGISDQEQVVTVVSGLPLYLLIMAFTLGPLSEELFFRAFLVSASISSVGLLLAYLASFAVKLKRKHLVVGSIVALLAIVACIVLLLNLNILIGSIGLGILASIIVLLLTSFIALAAKHYHSIIAVVLGILISTLLFTFTHVAYGSAAELAGAFALGLVLALSYWKLKDPLPCIVAHVLFNLLSVILIMWVY